MIKYDQHVHTRFSGDSSENPERHIKQALELGLDGINFTDHMDYDYPYEPAGFFEFDVRKYFRKLGELKSKYEGKLYVGRGIEIGLRNEPDICENMRIRLNELIDKNNFDYVIGSVHLLDKVDVAYDEYWRENDFRTALERYFNAVRFCTEYYDCFDTCGHLDYIVRYAPCDKSAYSPADYFDITDEILKTLIKKGKALEVNTKGCKPSYGTNAPNPGEAVIKRYKELGGELLTIGSDAHCAKDLAGSFRMVSDLLEACGIGYYTVFKKRVPNMLKL